MSETLRILALIGPITVATGLTALVASRLVARAGLAATTMIAIAVVASLVTVIDLVALNHFMLISPSDRIEVVLVAGYSLSGRRRSRADRRSHHHARADAADPAWHGDWARTSWTHESAICEPALSCGRWEPRSTWRRSGSPT